MKLFCQIWKHINLFRQFVLFRRFVARFSAPANSSGVRRLPATAIPFIVVVRLVVVVVLFPTGSAPVDYFRFGYPAMPGPEKMRVPVPKCRWMISDPNSCPRVHDSVDKILKMYLYIKCLSCFGYKNIIYSNHPDPDTSRTQIRRVLILWSWYTSENTHTHFRYPDPDSYES